MRAKVTVAYQIKEIRTDKGIAINSLADISNIPSSTDYSMLNEKSQNSVIIYVEKIYWGLQIRVNTLFNNSIFETVEVK